MALFRSLYTGGDKSYYEPFPRCWHYAAPVGERLFMWGGQTRNWSSERRSRLASVVEMYDPYLELWEQHPTSGTPPVGLYDGACASLLDSLYSYGGYDDFSYHGGLYHLNTTYHLDATSMSWSEVEVRNVAEGPMKKHGCRMVSYQGDKLLLAGGYGIPTSDLQPGTILHRDTRYTDGGWTNEVHLFHLQKGVWTSPATTGTRPPPRTSFSLTSIDPKRAVFFGGYQPEHGWVNDVHILDLEAMHWTKVDKSGEGPWPVGRSAHAACCINYGQEYPQLLVTGGRDKYGKVLGDSWLLDVDSATWKELALPADLPPRAGHTATAFSLAPGLTEVTMFGGFNKVPSGATSDNRLPKIAETTVLQFKSIEIATSGERPSTQEWDIVGVARKGQLASVERLREKIKIQKRKFENNIQPAQGVQERPATANRRAEEAEQRARDSETRAQEAERNAQKAQARVCDLEQQVHDTTTRAQQAETRATGAETRATEAERRRATEAEKQLQQEQQFWMVRRNEIELTNEILGVGGWGAVRVANFRGASVAAKCLYRIIVSARNRQLFKDELTMAARLHHPNLLQFIGATLEGELIILTELMPTSLRVQLEKGPLPHHQIISISLDVTRALNYLHLMRPDAIVYHDLSSTNVLLEPKPKNTWKAKISDYGSINLLQKLPTAMPGNPIYAAPESKDPSQQSPKMDIFSFGILLVELWTATFPDIPDRERLIQLIADHRMVRLIRECTAEDRTERPPAANIIAKLSEM